MLKLEKLGEDSWSRPTYRDQKRRLWKDVSCGMFDVPSLCSVVDNEPEGEPDKSLTEEYIIVSPVDELSEQDKHNYRMLGMLQSRCDYFLGYGNRSVKHLTNDSVEAHIAEMRKNYNLLPVKPEWLTKEDIDEYERKMVLPNCVGKG